jgi:hypothetical protein
VLFLSLQLEQHQQQQNFGKEQQQLERSCTISKCAKPRSASSGSWLLLGAANMWLLLLLLLQAEPVILLDPNTLSEDGTVALKDAVFR